MSKRSIPSIPSINAMTLATERILIVNADDFGQSAGVNLGIIRAHERGIVTSASLMVRWPAAEEAALYGRTHPGLSVGLHLDLGEWVCRDGEWAALYQVVDTDNADAVAAEASRQLAEFERLVGRAPTHIDSHQHVHRNEPVRAWAIEAARSLNVPLRSCCPQIRYFGNFYGQGDGGTPYPEGISVENLLGVLADLPPGVTELGCHPGEGNDLDTMYGSERIQEVKTLCDTRVVQAIRELGIRLVGYSDYPTLAGAAAGPLSYS